MVDVLGPGDAHAYDSFIRAHAESLFYHSWAYKEFLKNLVACEEEYLVARAGDTIRGALPLMRTGGAGASGRVYNSLPFFGTSAGILAGDAGAYNALASAYNDIARREDTLSATIVGSQFGPRRDAERLAHNYVDARIAQMTALPAEGDYRERLLAQFDSSARRNINKARAAGIEVSIDPGEFDRLEQMHRAGMDAIDGTPKTSRFFTLVPQHFVPHEDFDLYVARLDGAVIAALLLFYLGRTVEYYMPAVDPRWRAQQPLALLVCSAMTDAARRGFNWWNWGGTWTTQTGVYRFKKKWGAIERPYAYYTQLNDETLRTWPRERILATWPHFFVLPFTALTDQRSAS
ncbi:MAG: GNAT family N-acetyltransferase [Acidobacteriota bacterium]